MSPDLLPVDVAAARILAACEPLPAAPMDLTAVAMDPVPHFLAEHLLSRRALPPFSNSAMDGYAVSDIDTVPVTLKLVGESLAGHGSHAGITPGTAIAITTGAPIPRGATAVVMREQCDESGRAHGGVVVHHRPRPGEHIRLRGEDVDTDATVGAVGDVLSPARLNLLWSAGHTRVLVARRPTVAIMASGDELKEVGSALGDDDVVNSNAWAIAAACRRLGCTVRLLGIAKDTLTDHVALMQQGLVDDVDVLLTIGGVSVGSHDFVRPALQHLGASLSLWRLAMRPGKPLAFGAIPRPTTTTTTTTATTTATTTTSAAAVRFFGLPGNPVSAMVTFRLFVQPALQRLSGAPATAVATRPAILRDEVAFIKKRGLSFFARAITAREGNELVVRTVDRQGSGQVSGLADATALCCFAADDERIEPGSVVDVIDW
jgi:molybdopterin molybdotransferase